MTAQVQSADASKEEALIEALVGEQTDSWNKGGCSRLLRQMHRGRQFHQYCWNFSLRMSGL
jgi:hypothetical protein